MHVPDHQHQGVFMAPWLEDFAVVVDLHEFAPVSRRATGGRDGRRLERLAEGWLMNFVVR